MHILILTLTTAQSTLRMRVWRTLKNSGAAVLRDGVYLLPDIEEGYETFLTTCQEIRNEGGAAYVFTADVSEEEGFQSLFDRSEQYGEILKKLSVFRGALHADSLPGELKQLRKLRREFDRLGNIDFFPGEARQQTASALASVELEINQLISPGEPHAVPGMLTRLSQEDYQGRVWATRRRPWVDRLASAWLIRRFIDCDACFLWLEDTGICPSDAVGFDFVGAMFSHVDNLITFEVLVRRFGLQQRIPDDMGLLVHYLDVGGVQPPDATGVESILAGLRESITDDNKLLATACTLFDGLLMSFEMRSGNEQNNGTPPG
ncbi:chromate resistance protein [Pantoea agglomerans]|uniref:chromate resistance protein ChrB domain-containing protein n=2 Tax=Enterobacter agglomerans TaxID=549 RepID=UPI00289F3B07|nr:chromate resistance protein ChrB domain-containing protein [Pantoea agglomerans]WNK68814.1 chromate resistance protein [Pantoea agglomerans]